MSWRDALGRSVSAPVALALRSLSPDQAAAVREIRLRVGYRMEAVAGGEIIPLPFTPDRAGMDGLISAMSGGALYAHEQRMARGYITLDGGHRAGLCGRLAGHTAGVERMSGITSVCIRISRHIPGASAALRPHMLDGDGRARSLLLLGPPGSGKTTMLRDAAIYLAQERRLQVAAADEREELFPQDAAAACSRGIDVMTGADKAVMMRMLLRGMSPDVIVCDEIGGAEDASAVAEALRCGAAIMASAHAEEIEAMRSRPSLRLLMETGAFERLIVIGRRGRETQIYDGAMKRLEEDGRRRG